MGYIYTIFYLVFTCTVRAYSCLCGMPWNSTFRNRRLEDMTQQQSTYLLELDPALELE